MQHWTTYPLVTHPYNPELMSGASVTRFARAAEAAGFDGIAFTDHPVPSDKWLRHGGHDALDPFAVLPYVAAVTERIRLIPNIVVLPYRNPFLVAKSSATIDVLSGGRFTLSVATGYLRSEYRALGVDFERRNELFDEALVAMRGVWSTDAFSFEGSGYTAAEVSVNPKPSAVPIWIGGNSPLTRRRVAEHGDGWNPFPAPAVLAQTARTTKLESLDDLAPMLDHLWHHVELAGRDRAAIDVAFTTGEAGPGSSGFRAGAHLDQLGRMAELGVTWNGVGMPGDGIDHAVECLEQYGAEVIGPFAG